jgi:phosphoribosylglycinamide formyltransferase 1
VTFVLLTENTFHASYLVDKWFHAFENVPAALNIGIRSEPQSRRIRVQREAFHREQAGRRVLDKLAKQELLDLYPDASETDLAMIPIFGIPRCPAARDGAVHLGNDINGPKATGWLNSTTWSRADGHAFVFLDRLLSSWWMTESEGRVFNAHSAVLPYARGMYAIEQVAATGNIDHFRSAAGATVHFVDEGVDTGRIIRRERLTDPFGASSIWECKARSFILAFDLLTEVARNSASDRVLPSRPAERPGEAFGSPEFRRRDFGAARRAAAESGYLMMKTRLDLPDRDDCRVPRMLSVPSGLPSSHAKPWRPRSYLWSDTNRRADRTPPRGPVHSGSTPGVGAPPRRGGAPS